jgi:hypothetical protein
VNRSNRYLCICAPGISTPCLRRRKDTAAPAAAHHALPVFPTLVRSYAGRLHPPLASPLLCLPLASWPRFCRSRARTTRLLVARCRSPTLCAVPPLSGEPTGYAGYAGAYPVKPAIVKGKCAFGTFLSILVIKCPHKCLNVNLCPWMNKVQITSKGMFLSLSTLVLCTNILV